MPVRPRLASALFLAWLSLGAPGCRSKKSEGLTPAPGPSTSAARSTEGPSLGCREIGKGPALELGEKRPSADGEDDGPELPFAPEVGQGATLLSTFAASGLVPSAEGSEAVVALVPEDGKRGRRVSFGRVFGGAGPPSIAGRGQRLLVAVEDSDAAGATLRLYGLGAGDERPARGAEITGVERESGVALAIGQELGVLAWGKRTERGTVLVTATLKPESPRELGALREVAASRGAESLALRERPGGFWLAWIAEEDAGDAGAPLADAGEEGLRLVDFGARLLRAVPLDARGIALGEPRTIAGDRSSPVVGFDAVVAGGALVLAFRQGDSTPGVEGGSFELARVEPSGGVTRGRAGDDELRAGIPSLVADPAQPERTWVSVRGADDSTRLGLLDAAGTGTGSLAGDPLLSGAEVLAASGGRMLISRPRQRSIELSVLQCGF